MLDFRETEAFSGRELGAEAGGARDDVSGTSCALGRHSTGGCASVFADFVTSGTGAVLVTLERATRPRSPAGRPDTGTPGRLNSEVGIALTAFGAAPGIMSAPGRHSIGGCAVAFAIMFNLGAGGALVLGMLERTKGARIPFERLGPGALGRLNSEVGTSGLVSCAAAGTVSAPGRHNVGSSAIAFATFDVPRTGVVLGKCNRRPAFFVFFARSGAGAALGTLNRFKVVDFVAFGLLVTLEAGAPVGTVKRGALLGMMAASSKSQPGNLRVGITGAWFRVASIS